MFKVDSLRRAFRFMHGNILVLALTNLLGNFSRAMAFPYASLFILALGGEATQIGFINALAPLAGLLLFPLAGYITDYAGRVKLIVFSGYLSGLFLLFYVLAPSWQMVAFATLLRGIIVLQFPARSAIIADSLAPGDRGRGIATMRTISGTLSIFAPYLAGFIIDTYGPNLGMRFLYAVMTVAYLTSAAIQQRFLVETSPNAGHPVKAADLLGAFREAYSGIPALFRRVPPALTALAGVIVLAFMANAVVSPFWVVYAVEQIGLSSAAWGFVLLVETTLRSLLFIPAGTLVDRWGRTRLLLLALLLGLVIMPLFVFAHTFAAVLLLRIGVAVVQATFIPACVALMADLVPRAVRGRVMAALGQGGVLLGSAGGGTGGPGTGFLITIPLMISSLAGGALYAWHPTYPWFFVLGALALAVLLVILFIRDPETAEI